MTATTPAVPRKVKLGAVEVALALTRDARQKSAVGYHNRPPVDALTPAIAQWRVAVPNQLETAQIPKEWAELLLTMPQTFLGLDIAWDVLGVLRWRVRDRRSEELPSGEAKLVGLICWFDTWGTLLYNQALGDSGRDITTDADDTSFAPRLADALAFCKVWAPKDDPALAQVLSGLVDLVEDRFDERLRPYQLKPVDAWHVGWVLVTLGWLLADLTETTIPHGHTRLCHFPEAQQARATYREHGVVPCPRCESVLDIPERHFTLASNRDFSVIQATCESCEYSIVFPEQALPQSLWNQRISLVREELAQGNSGAEIMPLEASTRMTADPKKVFVIHGRNTDAAHQMDIFLRALNLTPIAFDELRASMGGTPAISDIVTKGMTEAQGVIALFTADEYAELQPSLRNVHDKEIETKRWQARPNVIFEAGMAFMRDRSRVVFVLLGAVELFSDVAGIHVLRLNNDATAGRRVLRDTLKGMGCEISDSHAWMKSGDFESCVLPGVSARSPFPVP